MALLLLAEGDHEFKSHAFERDCNVAVSFLGTIAGQMTPAHQASARGLLASTWLQAFGRRLSALTRMRLEHLAHGSGDGVHSPPLWWWPLRFAPDSTRKRHTDLSSAASHRDTGVGCQA